MIIPHVSIYIVALGAVVGALCGATLLGLAIGLGIVVACTLLGI